MAREKKEYYLALVNLSPYYEKILSDKKYTSSEFVEAGVVSAPEAQNMFLTRNLQEDN